MDMVKIFIKKSFIIKILRVFLIPCFFIICIRDVLASNAVLKSVDNNKELITSSESFNFVVISDRTGGHLEGEWEAAIKEINLLKPDFVVSVGDQIEGLQTNALALEKMWDEADSIIKEFKVPFFMCAGNHDVQPEYRDKKDVARKIYEKRYGNTFYSFNYKKCHFIVLDSTAFAYETNVAAAELLWLQKDILSNNDAAHFFVFYHHPLTEKKFFPQWQKIRTLLPAGKTTIFNGHTHQLSYNVIDGFPTYVLGSTGVNVSGNKSTGDFRMFARVAVNDYVPTIAFFPVHTLLSTSDADNIRATSDVFKKWLPETFRIGPKGGTIAISITNILPAPVKVDFKIKERGWSVNLSLDQPVNLKPGEKKDLTIEISSPKEFATVPAITCELVSAEKRLFSRDIVVSMWNEINLDKMNDFNLDGNFSEWSTFKKINMNNDDHVITSKDEWNKAPVSSCAFYPAIFSNSIIIAVEVMDKDITVVPSDPWQNDCLEFIFDFRTGHQNMKKPGPGFAQLIVPVQLKDGIVRNMEWIPSSKYDGKMPDSIKSFFKRIKTGYIIELIVPFTAFGVDTIEPGYHIGFDMFLDDMTGEGLDSKQNRLSLSGAYDTWQNSSKLWDFVISER